MKADNDVFSFNFTDVLKFLFKWKWHIGIVCLVAAIAAAIFSGPSFITPKYRSEVIFYPNTINSISNAILTDLTKRENDVLAFGEEEEAENALQILKSSNLMDRVIRNYNLMEHYGIDPNGPYPRTKLEREINRNISFERTRYLSISIQVMDKDPEMAAVIANGIAELYDSVKTEVQKELAREFYAIVTEEYKSKEQEVWDLKMKLADLGTKGLLDMDGQPQAISEALYQLKSNSLSDPRVKELQSEKDTIAKYGSEFTNLYETLILELEELSELRKRYKKAKVDVERSVTHKFILTGAAPAEKKSYPIRWLMVVSITLATFIMAVIALLLFEQIGKLKTD